MRLREPGSVIEQPKRRSEKFIPRIVKSNFQRSIIGIYAIFSTIFQSKVYHIFGISGNSVLIARDIPVRRVMSFEILDEHLVNTVRSWWVATRVSHRTSTSVQILPHHHRNFPQAWIWSCRTGRNHAVVEQFIVQGIRPTWWPILVYRHRWVVRKVRVP